jgi:hypothetical protein
MSAFQSLWASIQGDPVFSDTGWINSVTYVAALSLWALVSGHWSAWQAARVEVAQAEEHERREREDIPEDVVRRIVEETEVNPSPRRERDGAGFTAADSGNHPRRKG